MTPIRLEGIEITAPVEASARAVPAATAVAERASEPVAPVQPLDATEPCAVDAAQVAAAEAVAEAVAAVEPLLSLKEAVARIPEQLRSDMEEFLRAEFREVQRWHPPAGGHG